MCERTLSVVTHFLWRDRVWLKTYATYNMQLRVETQGVKKRLERGGGRLYLENAIC